MLMTSVQFANSTGDVAMVTFVSPVNVIPTVNVIPINRKCNTF